MGEHILRYGTNADKKYFTEHPDCYDIIAINAHMIAFTPDSLSLFVGRETIDKRFFIDPITHLFQHHRSHISGAEGNIKRSVAKLITEYAEGLGIDYDKDDDSNKIAEKQYSNIRVKLRSSQLDPVFVNQFTKNVLDFQLNFIKNKKADQYGKYVQFARNEDPALKDLKIYDEPEFLVAPYFFIESKDGWLEKNIQFIDEAKKINSKKKIYAQVVLSKDLITESLVSDKGSSYLNDIINAYTQSQADGLLVWVDNYSEHDEIKESLTKYLDILSQMKASGKKLISLYGSYFSIMLTHPDVALLDGVSHGLEYGEMREVVPVGGGLPVPKFYFYPLHKRMNIKSMVSLIIDLGINSKEKFLAQIGNSPIVQKLVSEKNILSDFQEAFGKSKPSTFKRGDTLVTMSFATSETKDHALRHYLFCKQQEFKSVTSTTLENLVKELKTTSALYSDFFDTEDVKHLSNWASAIEVHVNQPPN